LPPKSEALVFPFVVGGRRGTLQIVLHVREPISNVITLERS